MKKTTAFTSTQNHAKPFVVAIGIAFTFLALVVIYVAFTKGGLDIRSRAGVILTERCSATTPKKDPATGKFITTCLAGGRVKSSGVCCYKVNQTIVKPTMSVKMTSATNTPMPKQCTPGTAGCVVKNGQLMKVQSTVKKSTPVPTKALIRVQK